MGLHWLDIGAPELNGGEFRYTLYYGSWNGRIIFDEPMITKAVLESRETVDVTLPPRAVCVGGPSRRRLSRVLQRGDGSAPRGAQPTRGALKLHEPAVGMSFRA